MADENGGGGTAPTGREGPAAAGWGLVLETRREIPTKGERKGVLTGGVAQRRAAWGGFSVSGPFVLPAWETSAP